MPKKWPNEMKRKERAMNPETPPEPTGMLPMDDPFKHPGLFPEKWDLSELYAKSAASNAPVSLPVWYEPFDMPQTFPSRWDLA
jgi:hypothetical protein